MPALGCLRNWNIDILILETENERPGLIIPHVYLIFSHLHRHVPANHFFVVQCSGSQSRTPRATGAAVGN